MKWLLDAVLLCDHRIGVGRVVVRQKWGTRCRDSLLSMIVCCTEQGRWNQVAA
jgi:hypothetical protein